MCNTWRGLCVCGVMNNYFICWGITKQSGHFVVARNVIQALHLIAKVFDITLEQLDRMDAEVDEIFAHEEVDVVLWDHGKGEDTTVADVYGDIEDYETPRIISSSPTAIVC